MCSSDLATRTRPFFFLPAFKLGKQQQTIGKVIKKKKERKFKLTSDIVSLSLGIVAKKANLFAAITGQGLRPRVEIGRASCRERV